MRHKIKGIVIREAPKGETSKLLTVLTSSLGVITINAKGVRKLSSPYLKSAQLFAFSDMLLYEKNGYFTLSEAALITDFYALSKDIKVYSLACYFAEVSASFAIPGEESANILRLLLNSLYALEKNIAPIEIVKSAFELRICSECGFFPDISNCLDCESNLSDKEFMFHIGDGVAFCKNCAHTNNECVVLSPSVGKAITHITESELSRFISFRIGDADMRKLSLVSEKFLLARAERGFKTLSFYKHCEDLPQ